MRPLTGCALAAVVIAALLLTGCARRVPAGDLASAGADVGVRLRLRPEREIEGRLVSLTKDTIVLDVEYAESEGVELAGAGERLRVIARGEPVDGEILSVEGRGSGRRATVRMSFPTGDVAEATFHRSSREATLGPVVSALLGPLVGASLALLF